MNLITSKDNPIIKHAHALLTHHRTRKKSRQTVIEGVHLLDALLKQGFTPHKVILSEFAFTNDEVAPLLANFAKKDIVIITNTLYKNIRTLGDGVDIMAIIDTPMLTLNHVVEDCLILDGLQDAGNIGTLLRTASAVGITTIITTPTTAHLWSPKCLRASMGANFALSIHEHIASDEILAKVKTPLYATSSHTDKFIYHHDLTHPIAWVLGHEGQGVSDGLLKNATPIALPQPNGQESLNVGVAGGVCFYEMLRQRSFG
ncbi:RNA methyltransferase [Moraxella nonliquefaciens]|uniref:TrmH family RNA methyltransferase n=1 Tax=Moraxella nonliquefaciens TaxID=478 RepID=UPI0024A748E4|nr:RNA methyltransferase [Moraxella nonliquefaciens]MDI4497995.1 RNA methyltransferase [Moraxella nonliquefaciens]MDI4499758.1 RNA methyltransferase [Moraxella nonliquefaciens]